MSPATRIVSGLSLVFGEKLLVFVDRSRLPLAKALLDQAKALQARTQLMVLEEAKLPADDQMPSFVDSILADVQASVLLVGTEHSHALRRAFVEATSRLYIRHAHVIGLSERGFIEGFAADASRVSEMMQAVGRKVAGARRLSYRTPAGTNLEVKMAADALWTERGPLVRPGKPATSPGAS